MSAYSFGKIVTADSQKVNEKIMHLASISDIEVKFGFHEPGDQDMLEEPDLLTGAGVIFNLFTPGASDVITLCNEATGAGRGAIRQLLGEASLPYSWEQARSLVLPGQVYDAIFATRLGQFVRGLFQIGEAKSTGFAIFDNGVERVIEETATHCQAQILRSLLVAWDLGPNALFAWKNHAAVPPERQLLRFRRS